jgi:hypothetical protein
MMAQCGEVRARLDELLDGELTEQQAAESRKHLQECKDCREEYRWLQKLESILKGSVHREERPWDQLVGGVSARVRLRGRFLQGAAAAAAVLLIGLTIWNLIPGSPASDLHEMLRSYAAADGVEELRLQKEIHALGRDAIPKIIEALENTPLPVQIGAGKILQTYRDDLVTELLVSMAERQQTESDEWILEEIGTEQTDTEMVDVAFDLALDESGRERGRDLLRQLDRAGINVDVRRRIIDRLMELLKNRDADVQRAALDLIGDLSIEFPVPRLVEFFDVPEMKENALKVLRDVTGEDFGFDRNAWNKYWAERRGM